MKNLELENLSDIQLVQLAKENNNHAENLLISRYTPYVYASIRPYFLIGGEKKDLVQEGLIGLALAIRTFNGKSSFKSYAITCVKSKIITAIKKYNNTKNKPMNNYLSLNGDIDNDVDKSALMLDSVNTPEEILVNQEQADKLIENIKYSLSKLECEIFDLYIQGYSYLDIAEKLEKNEKAIDNALQRIRKKASATRNKLKEI